MKKNIYVTPPPKKNPKLPLHNLGHAQRLNDP